MWGKSKDKHSDTHLEANIGLAKRNDDKIKDVIKNEIKNGQSTAE